MIFEKRIILDKSIPEPMSGCWIWLCARTTAGYGMFRRGKKAFYAHRYSYEAFNGRIKGGMEIRHKCNNPICCNPDHLIQGTRKENSDDMIRAKRQARGQRHGHAKFSEDDIIVIRKMLKSGISQAKIALDFNVDASSISFIKTGRNWGWFESGD